MLSENTVDELIQPFINHQNQIEMTIILKIAERIKEIGEMLPSDVYKLERLFLAPALLSEIKRKKYKEIS